MLAAPMKNQTLQTLAALALFAAAMASRLYTPFGGTHMPWLENFSPLAAICLCGAIYLPRKMAVLLPVSIIFVSDLMLNAHYQQPWVSLGMLPNYIAFGLIIWLGWAIRKHGRLWVVIPAGLLGSILFYLITNTGAWISNPAYGKSFAGWAQALTTGIPGYPPTWMFYRSTLVSDLLFTTLFVVCMVATDSRTHALKPARHPAPFAS